MEHRDEFRPAREKQGVKQVGPSSCRPWPVAHQARRYNPPLGQGLPTVPQRSAFFRKVR
jgi:hypothetical protein